jgi:NlpC/P60 family putative phage cell wall peptidase
MNIREQIIQEARTFIGTPFHHQGRLKGIGVDCVGLVALVGKTLSIFDYDSTDYSKFPDGKTLMNQVNKAFVPVDADKMQIGDIIVFWIVNPRVPTHLGILTDHGFIHTYETIGKVVEHRLNDTWKKRIVGVYKYPGVE